MIIVLHSVSSYDLTLDVLELIIQEINFENTDQ